MTENTDAIQHAGEIPADLVGYIETRGDHPVDPSPSVPQRFVTSAETTSFANPQAFEKVIREFSWDNYGMDDVDYLLQTDPDAQEWVPALAQKLQAAVSQPLPTRTGFDMLRQVFESQAYFQGLLGHNYNDMEPEELVEYIKNQVLALLDEGHEALNEVGWKPWASSRHVNREALGGELADILCFLVNLALAAGLDSTEFYRLHQEKALRNIKRQEEGYDGASGKCPGCGRAIDDLKAKGLPTGNFGGVDYCSHECIQKKNPALIAGTGIPFHDTNKDA